MRSAGLVFCLACFLVSRSAWAGEAETSSFFKAFKTICADTRAEPAAVVKAVSAAGGLAKADIAAEGTTGATWRLTVEGRPMIVSSSAGKAADGAGRRRLVIDCEITSLNDERSNLAAFGKWAGVAGDGGSFKTGYAFREESGTHVATTRADDDKEHWILSVMPGGKINTVQLMHVLAFEP
jgi:hypothetical protein